MADKKNPIYTTPKGTAKYCHLVRPSTKFNPEGVYDVTLLLDGADAENLINLIDEKIADNKAEIQKEPKYKKHLKECDPPYKEDLDKDGDETGFISFKFSMKAQATSKKTGETYTFTPVLYDAKRNVIHPKTVGFGSLMRIAFEVIPFNVAAIGAGVSLRLKAAQILELNSSDGLSAEACGFEDEDGYTNDTTDEAEFADETAESEGKNPSDF